MAWCGNKRARKECSYFSFPKETKLRNKWIKFAANASDWEPKPSSVICSDHFGVGMLIKGKKKFLLKKNAIPGKTRQLLL